MEEIETVQTSPVTAAPPAPVTAAEVITPPQPSYEIPAKKGSIMRTLGVVGLFVVIIGAGVGTGYGLSTMVKGSASGSSLTGAPGSIQADEIAVGKTYGAEDGKKFPDVSEGVVVKGGMDGEGTHHLVRPGGVSQTVYLTSSVVDLDLFENHKVQVKGETFSAQKAAWFMDVGSVKVLELNVAQPESPAADENQVPAGE